MKNLKKWIFVTAVSAALAFTVTSCGGLSTLSDDEAYNLGYSIGKAAGYYLNN